MNRSRIRSLIREATLVEAADFSDSKLNDVLDDGYHRITSAFEWPWLSATASLNVTAGNGTVALPSDYRSGAALHMTATRVKLEQVGHNSAWDLFGGDLPTGDAHTHFFLWDMAIELIPVPDTSETGRLTLRYYKTPTPLANDSDEPEWDESFHDLLVNFGAAYVWQREEDFDRAKFYGDEYARRMNAMAGFYLSPFEHAPLIVGANPVPLRTPWPQHTRAQLLGL